MTMPNPTGNAGFLGGVTGTLGGTNALQSSIDQLTNSVNRLTNVLGTLNFGGGKSGGSSQQQYSSSSGGFPKMFNPFLGNNYQTGIGGGGPGGAGNITQPMPFGRTGLGAMMMLGGITGYGNQQMPTQLGLNAYATVSQLGMSIPNGGYGLATNMLMRQAFGMNNQNLNNIANSPMDALQMTQILQSSAYNPNIMGSALGRASFGAMTSFGFSNPSLSGASAARLAAGIYSPQLSQAMLAMGYPVTPRRLGGGNPSSMGNVVQGILQSWFNKNKVNPTTLFANLQPGSPGYANLSYLAQSAGMNPSQLAPVIESYNQLFNRGLSPARATQLFSQAYGTGQSSKNAMKTLQSLGVTTVTSDIQRLKNNQAGLLGRSSDIANSFNSALGTATSSLEQFNLALNRILHGAGDTALGQAGAYGGIFSGTNHGNSLLTLGGAALLGSRLARGRAAAAGAEAATAGRTGMLSRLGLGSIFDLLPAAAFADFAGSYHFGQKTMWQMGNVPADPKQYNAMNSWSGLLHALANLFGGGGAPPGVTRFNGMGRNVGGGAALPGPQTAPKGGTQSSAGAGVARQAVTAVHDAEKEIGVPYVWGGEQPGVGFDCSGLVQWAYRQAGVSIPRTSQQQWAALARRSIALNKVQEGDLVFQAGSDGTVSAPGHVAMMINQRQIIEAPFTGANVRVRAYNPGEWQHAARPVGNTTGSAAGGSSIIGTSGRSAPGTTGNKGLGSGTNSSGPGTSSTMLGVGGGFAGIGVSESGMIPSLSELSSLTGGGAPMGMSPASMGSSSGAGIGSAGSAKSAMSGSGNAGLPGHGTGGPTVVPTGSAQHMGQQLAKAYGWSTGINWNDLVKLWNGESGWRWNATNPSSGAYGIPQALPASKMASAGSDWRTNPATQIKWGLAYIKGRYGSPANAYNQWLSRSPHWYAGGGMMAPGWSVVGERGPELMYTGGGGSVLSNAQSMAMLKYKAAQPAQTPWKNMRDEASAISGGSSFGPHNLHLNFGQNAIQIKIGGLQASDVSSAGKEMVNQFVHHLSNMDLLSAIKAGQK